MLALWGRAEARDHLDVDPLLHLLSLQRMLDLAAEKDLGFDPRRLADAITAAVNGPDSAYTALGISAEDAEALRGHARTWLTTGSSQRMDRSTDAHDVPLALPLASTRAGL